MEWNGMEWNIAASIMWQNGHRFDACANAARRTLNYSPRTASQTSPVGRKNRGTGNAAGVLLTAWDVPPDSSRPPDSLGWWRTARGGSRKKISGGLAPHHLGGNNG